MVTMAEWRILTKEETEAYDNDPRTIEWGKYLDRCAANARLHCNMCGRFVKAEQDRTVGFGEYVRVYVPFNCKVCGPGEVLVYDP
jgi:hypothetical protein